LPGPSRRRKASLRPYFSLGKELVRKSFARASGIGVKVGAASINPDDADQSLSLRGRPGRLLEPSSLMPLSALPFLKLGKELVRKTLA
jgi:hypothetical protein